MSSSQRWALFWGSVLLLLALCFLLKALGVIDDVLGYFWAGFLMLAGIGLLLSALVPPPSSPEEDVFVVDLQGAQEAAVEIHHGVGSVEVAGGAPPGAALTVNRGVGLNTSSRLEGGRLEVKVDCAPSLAPLVGPEGGAWRIRLTEKVPLTLKMESGASHITLDLRDVLATSCKLEAGASQVALTVPAWVANAQVDVEAGVAALDIQVPEGVAARIVFEDGLAVRNISPERFPLLAGDVYQSPGYERAPYRVELRLDVGASSVTVR